MAGKYTSPYFEVLRAKVILFASEGLENKEIASRVDIPRQILSKMAQESKGKPAVEFLSTQPLDKNRIARIRTQIPEAMKYYRPRR